jgi:hypothetical protein
LASLVVLDSYRGKLHMMKRTYVILLSVTFLAGGLNSHAQEAVEQGQRKPGRDSDSGQAYRAQADRVLSLIDLRPGEDLMETRSSGRGFAVVLCNAMAILGAGSLTTRCSVQ